MKIENKDDSGSSSGVRLLVVDGLLLRKSSAKCQLYANVGRVIEVRFTLLVH
jgi:hypothetical protein